MKQQIDRVEWSRSGMRTGRVRYAVASILLAGGGLAWASSAQVLTSCGSPTALTHAQVLISATEQDGFAADIALSDDDLALAVGSRGEGGFGEDFETNLFLGGSWQDTNDHLFLSGPHRVDFDAQRLLVGSLDRLQTHLRAGNGIYPIEQGNFGLAEIGTDVKDVAIDGNAIIVGYGPDAVTWEGRVAIFEHDGTSWSKVASFAAPSGSFEQLGRSVDIQGNVAVAGAPAIGNTPGRVREYLRVGVGSWVEGAVLTAQSLVTEGDRFGWSVALDGTRLAVGAPLLDVGGLPPLTPDVGGVVLFRRTFPTLAWEREVVLVGSGTGSQFGESVELIGSVLALGAPGAGSGQATIYRRQGASWLLCHVLTRPANASGFGIQVTMGTRGFFATSKFYVESPTLYNRAVFFYPLGVFGDGFESGGTSQWSGTVH